MAGLKLFTNTSDYHYQLSVSLLVRASEDPRNEAGTVNFELTPGQSAWHEYGNHIDIYLNGIKLAAFLSGQMVGEQHVFISRGSPLDDQLNTRNAVDFSFGSGSFKISTREV